jgi:hypothetical protein
MVPLPSYFLISECPLCHKPHKFPIVVIRSSMLLGTSTDKPLKPEWSGVKLFTCPKTGNKFQGTVILRNDPNDRIMSIKIDYAIE